MRSRALSRRSFLRGAGGVAVALPTLEIMLNGNGDAYANGVALPKRFGVCFGGHALGGDFDPLPNELVPDLVGPGYDLKRAARTLANNGDVTDRVSIVSGLRIPYDNGGGIPAGGWGKNFHTQGLCPLFSGTRNAGPDDYRVMGPSADQVVADAFAGQTTIRSLVYQVQAAWYLSISAPYGRDRMSYRMVDGVLQEVPGQASPKAAYDQLFTGFVPPDPSDALKAAYELRKRQSVVDAVRGDYEALLPKLGAADKDRLDRHLSEIRDLQALLDAIPPDASETCFQLPDPGPDPTVGGAQESVGGADYDSSLGFSDEDVRARIFADLIAMAFACDLTRSFSLLYTMAQSHMNASSFAGVPYDQHEVGHSGLGTPYVSDVVAWHLDLFGYLVAKLRDTPEGAGSLLDSCAIVYLSEAGHGFDPASLNEFSTHSTENMAVLTAGGAGGMVQGEHLPAPGSHPVQAVNAAMHAVGVTQDLGEVVGEIPGLRR